MCMCVHVGVSLCVTVYVCVNVCTIHVFQYWKPYPLYSCTKPHATLKIITIFLLQVGETYGRKLLKGYIEATKGMRVSERKLKQVLPAIAPVGHYARQTSSLERSNPAIYSARYFGHKVHLDQNEKLIHFGVTYVMARDGFSGKIVGGAVMPCKNNLVIYDEVYRTAVLEFGLWDQVRVDHGKEFYLTLYVHEKLRVGRGNQAVAPYAQTTSTCNHVIERIWVELNHRVTYPVKRIVTAMNDQQLIDMNCPITKFCVSTVLCRVCKIGMDRMILAWNSHPIPRRGVPNTLQVQAFHTSPIHPAEVPQCSTAVSEYRQQGGRLTPGIQEMIL